MKVIFVVGQTGSGKTSLALKLARQFQGEIVNCDSVQVYRDFMIGAASPQDSETKQVPHHLYNFVHPQKIYTAGQYSRSAHELLLKLRAKKRPIFIVGGTGFYFQALEKGLYPIPAASEAVQTKLESVLKNKGGALQLYTRLQDVDPIAAKRISMNDHYRLVRALEIFESTGKSLTHIQQEFAKKASTFPYPLLKMGPIHNRSQLLERITFRTEHMLKSGLLEEVQNIVRTYGEDCPPLRTVGYREAVKFLKSADGIGQDICVLKDEIVTSTMQFAKKQRTWFKRDLQINWLHEEEMELKAQALVSDFLQDDCSGKS